MSCTMMLDMVSMTWCLATPLASGHGEATWFQDFLSIFVGHGFPLIHPFLIWNLAQTPSPEIVVGVQLELGALLKQL